jgi:hypothetical protein
VIIGNSRYPAVGDAAELPAVRNDVAALSAVVKELVPRDRHDARVHVIEDLRLDGDDSLQRAAARLHDEVAEWRRDSLVRRSWYVPDRGDEVLLLVHYSGHGYDDGVEQYLQASDSDFGDERLITLSDVLVTLCGEALTAADAVVVTMDCCRRRLPRDVRMPSLKPFVRDAEYVPYSLQCPLIVTISRCCRVVVVVVVVVVMFPLSSQARAFPDCVCACVSLLPLPDPMSLLLSLRRRARTWLPVAPVASIH